MQALIFCLTFPVIPIVCALYTRRTFFEENGQARKDRGEPRGLKEKITGKELLIRYALYTLITQLLVSLVMVFLCDPGTSFAAKADASPSFTLKFAAIELAAAGIVALAEWMYVTRRIRFRVMWQEYREMGICRFAGKYIVPYAIYLAAAAVVLLNVSLMFDNVLWGDECFSANTAGKDVDGILQVMYFWDNHPPLYYYWAKLFGEVLGHTGWVYHLASLSAFMIGLVLALVLMRRRFGKIPTTFFIVISGLASSCLRYNVEIRMYSLAFLGVAGCYYCAYRVVSGGKAAWFGMVFWALVGAYSHYYAMMTAGILIFITGVATAVRFRGKTWIKSVAALIAYIAGYSPWFPYLFRGTGNVMNNWWMTDIMGVRECMQMILYGPEFEKIVSVLLVVCSAALFVVRSSFLEVNAKEIRGDGDKDREWHITLHRPVLGTWTDQTYGAAIGVLTIIGTLIAAYLICLVVGPVLTGRYLYPVSAVTAVLLVISVKGALELLEELGQKLRRRWPTICGKTIFVLALLLLFVIGLGNYKVFRAEVKAEQAVTEQTLSIIGEVPEDTALVSNGVKHLAWTVLYYYYPHREVVTGRCSDEGAEYDRFWYFTPEEINKGEMQEMKDMGYSAECYGTQQIATYPFELYYFEKETGKEK